MREASYPEVDFASPIVRKDVDLVCFSIAFHCGRRVLWVGPVQHRLNPGAQPPDSRAIAVGCRPGGLTSRWVRPCRAGRYGIAGRLAGFESQPRHGSQHSRFRTDFDRPEPDHRRPHLPHPNFCMGLSYREGRSGCFLAPGDPGRDGLGRWACRSSHRAGERTGQSARSNRRPSGDHDGAGCSCLSRDHRLAGCRSDPGQGPHRIGRFFLSRGSGVSASCRELHRQAGHVIHLPRPGNCGCFDGVARPPGEHASNSVSRVFMGGSGSLLGRRRPLPSRHPAAKGPRGSQVIRPAQP